MAAPPVPHPCLHSVCIKSNIFQLMTAAPCCGFISTLVTLQRSSLLSQPLVLLVGKLKKADVCRSQNSTQTALFIQTQGYAVVKGETKCKCGESSGSSSADVGRLLFFFTLKTVQNMNVQAFV